MFNWEALIEPKLKTQITMGQSLVKNYIHIVFSTKHRTPLINNRIEKELHRYLGGICNKLYQIHLYFSLIDYCIMPI